MIDRKSKVYKSMCYRVRRRDRNKCQNPKCDHTCKKTEVHHIFPVSTHEHLALDEKNCCTLCVRCHEYITGKEFTFAGLLKAIVDSKYIKKEYLAKFLGLKYGPQV